MINLDFFFNCTKSYRNHFFEQRSTCEHKNIFFREIVDLYTIWCTKWQNLFNSIKSSKNVKVITCWNKNIISTCDLGSFQLGIKFINKFNIVYVEKARLRYFLSNNFKKFKKIGLKLGKDIFERILYYTKTEISKSNKIYLYFWRKIT